MKVIATAGHVDHGKSALLRALTGMEPDRWAEEQRRGLTIDLGYAWLTLPSGERIAFVDVPGHERFAANMLAGVGPVPAALFVVAADGGWMPQSAEHLAVLAALGIRHVLLAVTRCDLAGPGPALAAAGEEFAAAGLGPVPAVAVSAVTGEGLPRLRAELAALAGRMPAPDPSAAIRLWVDRAFSISGSGTVVTGTLPAGTVARGDELLLAPGMTPVRVRGLESLGEKTATATGVARVALNLRGLHRGQVRRGMALIRPSQWTLTTAADIRLSPPIGSPAIARSAAATAGLAPAAQGRAPAAGALAPRNVAPDAGGGTATPADRRPPERNGLFRDEGPVESGRQPASAGGGRVREVAVHLGSARTTARVRLLGGDIARLTLRDPLPMHVGDRLLLRDAGSASPSGHPVVRGATVLDVAPPPLTRRGAAAAAAAMLAAWPDRPGPAELLERNGLIRSGALRAMGMNDLPPPLAGDWVISPDLASKLAAQLAEAVAAHAKADPLAPGLPAGAAQAALGLPDRRLAEALVRPPLTLRDGAIWPAGPAPATTVPNPTASAGTGPAGAGLAVAGSPAAERAVIGPDEARVAGAAGPAFPASVIHDRDGAGEAGSATGTAARPRGAAAAGSGAPGGLPGPVADAVAALRADLAAAPFLAPDAGRLAELGLHPRAVAAAARAGLLLRVSDQIVLAPGAAEQAAGILAGLPQPFTTAEARKALGSTRRVVIPLLEYLDRAGVTQRLPDDRRLVREA
jgi:selenocysteine-specific elongation factor